MTAYNFQQLIDFTRTSSATFVGSNGLIQNTPASVNLLTYTQEFDNAAWTKLSTTVTANSTVAPDGTPTADKLAEDATNNQHRANATYTFPNTNPHTLSVYAKAAERSWVRVNNGSDNLGAFFNLADGTVGTVTAGTTASITAVGDGWYRCAVTFSPLTAAAKSIAFNISTDGATTTYTGNGTSGIFLWGAQLELGSTATDYTRNVGGLFPARFDYDPVTLAPRGILIEEQRTNLATYSEQFDNAAWSKGAGYNSTISANTAVAPDGTTTADSVVADSSGGTGTVILARSVSVTSGTSYTLTFFAKANTLSWVRLFALGYTSPANGGAYFNLSGAGAVGTVDSGYTASITAFANGWYRCALSFTAGSTATGELRLLLANANNDTAVARNGTSSVYAWGAQVEAGAFATSYIPTVASQVTRTADQASIVAPMFAPWYNQTEGTFVVRYLAAIDAAGTYRTQIKTDNAGSTNYIQIRNANLAPTTAITNSQVAQGATQADMSSATLVGGAAVRIALAYKVNNFAAVTNGATPVTDVSGTVPSDLIALTFGGGTYAVGQTWFSSITYYPVRLLDAQLQALTA